MSHRVYPMPNELQSHHPLKCTICVGGTSKIVGGMILCPVLCPISMVAGIGYTLYHVPACCDSQVLNRRDSICMCCGIATSYMISKNMVLSGVEDIKNICRVEQDMVRD
jgi:hypothetical protein